MRISELDHGKSVDPSFRGVAKTVPSKSRLDQVSSDTCNLSTSDSASASDPGCEYVMEGNRLGLTCKRHDTGR